MLQGVKAQWDTCTTADNNPCYRSAPGCQDTDSAIMAACCMDSNNANEEGGPWCCNAATTLSDGTQDTSDECDTFTQTQICGDAFPDRSVPGQTTTYSVTCFEGCVAGEGVQTYVNAKGTQVTECDVCPDGKYSEFGPSACIDCPAGRIGDGTGMSAEDECQVCEQGKYADAVGQTECACQRSPPKRVRKSIMRSIPGHCIALFKLTIAPIASSSGIS